MALRQHLHGDPVTRPFTAPVTTLATDRDRRTFGHFRATREATVRGIPPGILSAHQVGKRRKR